MADNWQKNKEEHLALSAAAADQYDELYEHANFATGSYMRYELETIERFIPYSPSLALAVDLGCGTGRDSFLLAKHFGQVYAYDFSIDMIRVANRNKLKKRAGNVLFEAQDIEDGPLPLANDSVSLVNTAFGMGSFIRKPEVLFREVRRILQPRGIALFSFYNSVALVNQLELEWRPALAARVVASEDVLQVDFEERSYRIAARAYKPKEIKKTIEGNFKLLEITTYPILSALFPQTLFKHSSARDLCSNVDKMLANNIELGAGPYIVAVCQKGGAASKTKPLVGYERVLELLRIHNIPKDIREHRPVRTMSDVTEVLDAPLGQMVKSILIAMDEGENTSPDDLNAELFLIAISADRNISIGKVATVLGRPRKKLRFATQIEVEKLTGFEVGSIAPFGLPRNIPVILDARLASLDTVWCGTGKATESLRLSVINLKKLSAYTVGDVSKPMEPNNG